jgi:hypothetical protein
VWCSRTPDGVRCAHFPSVITTIMDYKVQLINSLNLGELYICGDVVATGRHQTEDAAVPSSNPAPPTVS